MSRFGEYSDSAPPRRTRSWRRSGPRRRGGSPESSRRNPPPLGPRLGRGPVAEALDQPLVVVAVDERGNHPARRLQRLEAMQVEALLLERPHEPLDHAVALGLAHVRRRDRDPQPFHLADPGIGDVLRAPVTADREPARDVFPEVAEGVTDSLADRLQGRPAIAEL